MPVSEVDIQFQDAELPALPVLLSPAASEIVAHAVEGDGGRIHSLKREYASYRPRRRILVSYEAEVEWPNGSFTEETIVALARSSGELPGGAIRVEVAGTTAALWRLPHDPYLPGLPSAMDPAYVSGVLERLGLPSVGIEVTRRAYWPRSRAVLRVATQPSRNKLVFRPGQGLTPAGSTDLLYLKVVEPEDGEGIYRAHRTLAGYKLPIPNCHAWLEDEGILVLEPMPGRPLYDAVQDGHPAPDGQDLLALLDRLAAVPIDGKPRETSTGTVKRYMGVLQAVLPGEAERIDRFVERLGEDSDEPLITSHGDFHEYQVLVDSGRVSGLLDIDEVGPGQRLDDLAMMAARFWSFAPFERRGRERLEQYTFDLLRTFGEVVDPVELHRRVAAVLFARATSPFRNQERGWPREISRIIALAEDWLDRPVVS
jgi:aminoglycoside phosphotransferase